MEGKDVMESGEQERLALRPDLHPRALDLLVDESLRMSSELLSRYVITDDYNSYSARMPMRLGEEIRLSKQMILSNALTDEWNLALDSEYPLHSALGLEVPLPEDSADGIARWQLPLSIPELPDEYTNACIEYLEQHQADFTDLDDMHSDYMNRPKLFELLRSLDGIAQGGYSEGAGDTAYELVKKGLFDGDYTLEYDGSLYLLAFMPQESAGLIMNMMSANQVAARMDESLDVHELENDEREMVFAMKNVLKAEALTGQAWHEFASKFGGISAFGSEQASVSAEGLWSLLQARRLARRGTVNRVIQAYLTAVESTCYGVKGVIETVSVNDFAVGSPWDIARAQFNSPLRLVISSDPELCQRAVQPAKTGLKAVVIDDSLEHSVIAGQIINEQTAYSTNEDHMYRTLDLKAPWASDPEIGLATIDLNSKQPAYYLELLKSIVDLRLKMSADTLNPDFTLVIWSTETETVEAVYEWFGKNALEDDTLNGAILAGEVVLEAPFHHSNHPARIKIIIQPKQARLPRPTE